ncbi:MAG: hypothetical protein H7222_11565 [Methylotenera sp.]|nr:hypothetical protein [Oligoflexia bacterium]
MKMIQDFMLVTIAVSTLLAASASQAASPVSFLCREVSCADFEKPTNAASWCGTPTVIELQAFGGQGPRKIIKSADVSNEEVCDTEMAKVGSLSRTAETISLNFSDGDQQNTFSFSQKSLIDLRNETIQSIAVTELDGFDWADGHHDRYTKTFSCISRSGIPGRTR